MKTLQLISYIKKGLLGLLILSSWSCQDEIWSNMMGEGEEATLNVQVDLDEMTPLTRANMSSELENRVNNLWVGVYNVASGKRTGFVYVDNQSGDYPEKEKKYGNISLKALSGESYIVAVANYANHQGITVDNTAPQDLQTLLDNADTWDKYRSIILSRNYNTGNDFAVIDAPTNSVEHGLVMQGSYRANLTDHSHADDDPETVAISSGTNNLTGKIHLRRLWTQNTVNFEADGDVVSMEVLEMEVLNVPQYSWLQSRSQGEDAAADKKLSYANAGDALKTDATATDNPNYLESLKITQSSMDMTTGTGNATKYSYDFWQYENKRTGKIGEVTDPYAQREKEVKDAGGSNTGVYTALCPDRKWTLDNNGTYIRFKAIITYKTNAKDDLTPDEIKDDDDANFSGITQRTAETTYVVHLGYFNNDANDFNCYRNAKYTYNIKVASVNKVLVEAFREDGEHQPGAEGEVNDVTDRYYNLDCHFNVFNIYLTNQELQNFTFTMRTYENNVAHDVKYFGQNNSENVNVPTSKTDPNWKYYSWVQLVPNDAIKRNDDVNTSTAIAEFPELNSDGTAKEGKKLYYLKDLAENGSRDFPNGSGFTVYVKEYTYEADYGEKDYGNEEGTEWTKYVNQPDRSAHFNVSFKESADKESIYYKSKYAFSQKSIQTYYNVAQAVGATGEEATALGIEHENEVFGMNIRWPNTVNGLSADNGRWNVALGLGMVSSGNSTVNSNINWSNAVTRSSLQHINQINNTSQTRLAYHISTAARNCPVPATAQINSNDLMGTSGNYNGLANDYDPQTSQTNSQYIYALHACMNRNKDENGNGRIDPAELKWYVPASGKYLRMILGRNALKTPLMNYEQETLPAGCGTGQNTLYHFMSSDNKIIWVNEGASSSHFNGQASIYSYGPWQVRCIRNFGTDLSQIRNGERVLPAYNDKDKDENTHGGVVKVKRYYGGALREPQTDPLPMHKSDDPYNRIARYGFEIAPCGNTFEGNHNNEATPKYDVRTSYNTYAQAVRNGEFCSDLNNNSGRRGWRLPNQKEIIIMLRMGVLVNHTDNNGNPSTSRYVTCTQEHWANAGTAGSSEISLSWNYRLLSVKSLEKIAYAANSYEEINSVRCVRDLTAAEADKSYAEISGTTTRASKAKKRRR